MKENSAECQRNMASYRDHRFNRRAKRKSATQNGRKLQRAVGEILRISEQKKVSVMKTTLEECYYERCVDRSIGDHRWRTWVEAFYNNIIILPMVKAEEPHPPTLQK